MDKGRQQQVFTTNKRQETLDAGPCVRLSERRVSLAAVSKDESKSVSLCFRVHVAGLNKGGMDTFMDNLPGFPDNIRPSSTGGYWVTMSAVRPNPGFSMLDFLSQRPWIKKLIFKVKRVGGQVLAGVHIVVTLRCPQRQ